jgi:hypothetical protein
MRLRIDCDGRDLFDYGSDAECVLLPLAKGERAAVFQMLSDALAMLAGVTPTRSSVATADERDQSNSQSPRCSGDRMSGGLLRLVSKRDAEAVPSMRDTDSRVGSDHQ